MKRLQENSTSGNLANQLLEDLSFIKQHKRYPLRRMTLMPFVASLALLCLFIAFVAGNLPFAHSAQHHPGSHIVFALMVTSTVIACKRYLNMIRFTSLKTPFFLMENCKLLQRFLEDNHFAFFHHPEAPEIFMILSKNIGGVSEEREVAVFIADDRRILINSHFTASRKRLGFLPGSTHQSELIRMLQRFLTSYTDSTTSLVRR